MSAEFTIEQANALIPEVAGHMARLVELQREAAGRLSVARRRARGNGRGGGVEPPSLAEMREALGWFEERGIQVRGVAPPLVDFPARHRDRDILLCWTEGEARIGWYHLPDEGFAGRRPVGELGG